MLSIKPFTCCPSRRRHWSWQLETIDPAWEKSHTKLIGKRRVSPNRIFGGMLQGSELIKKISVYHEWWIDASAVLSFVIYTVKDTTLWVHAQQIHDRNKSASCRISTLFPAYVVSSQTKKFKGSSEHEVLSILVLQTHTEDTTQHIHGGLLRVLTDFFKIWEQKSNTKLLHLESERCRSTGVETLTQRGGWRK